MADLISRAAAIERMVDMANCGVCQHYGHVKCRACSWNDAMNILDEAPAVDAVPVVHAEWIETTIPANTTGHGGVGQDKKNGWLCPNCRCAFDAKLLWCKNYCPNCGADMRGDNYEK